MGGSNTNRRARVRPSSIEKTAKYKTDYKSVRPELVKRTGMRVDHDKSAKRAKPVIKGQKTQVVRSSKDSFVKGKKDYSLMRRELGKKTAATKQKSASRTKAEKKSSKRTKSEKK